MTVIDTPWNAGREAAELEAAGVRCVMRYYNHRNSSALPEKRLTAEEVEALAEAGLLIGAVFQQRQNQAADFSLAKGKRDGKRAYTYAQKTVAQPQGSGIYFAVDFDAVSETDIDAVIAYFEGVHEVFGDESGGAPEYRVGAYGSGTVLRTLGERGLASLFWLSMSRGFSGTREFFESGDWHLNQRNETTIAGLDVDTNDVNPFLPDFGAFDAAADTAAAMPALAAQFTPGSSAPHTVIARRGLRLRTGPGTEFDIVRVLPFGTTLFVLHKEGRWGLVDLKGDGKADGHCHLSFLRPIA